jgi:1-acyl-sn-glycerol-3-phosphate acyltransferase
MKSMPTLIRLGNSLHRFNHYSKDVDRARRTGDPVEERRVIASCVGKWGRDVARILDLHVNVIGSENVPEHDGLVFISNHQGYADIIALILALPGRQIGFVAKEELSRIPLLGTWINKIRGFFLKRGDAREALKSMRQGSEMLKQGFNLVIFPEGTRSNGPEMGEFKPGSFRLATGAKADIVPVSISGSYKVYEEKGRVVHGRTITVMFHKPVETASLDRRQLKTVETNVENVIRQGLTDIAEKN